MLFNRFFKQPKPNKFGYTPVYFDEKKIERERKIAQVRKEKGLDYDSATLREHISFRGEHSKSSKISRNDSLDKFRNQANAKSNRMTFFILIVLAAIIYVQFFY